MRILCELNNHQTHSDSRRLTPDTRSCLLPYNSTWSTRYIQPREGYTVHHMACSYHAIACVIRLELLKQGIRPEDLSIPPLRRWRIERDWETRRDLPMSLAKGEGRFVKSAFEFQ